MRVIPEASAIFNLPFTERKKVLAPGDFNFSEQDAFDIPTRKKSVAYKESVSSSEAGISYKMQVEWEMEAFTPSMAEKAEKLLKRIETGVNQLIITIVDGQRILARNVEGASALNFIDDRGLYKCSWEFHSCVGFQRLPGKI